MRQQTILRVVTKLLIPYILLFAFYVQFHGDFGPGGGFQAGVILAAGIVLYSLVFGLQAARRIARPVVLEVLIAVGLLTYAGTGLAALLLGGHFLDYNALNPHHPEHGQELGIFLIELGVGTAVATVITSIFFAFAGRRQP
jgi:multicomponent Na+:H+ antiporter subunit B